MPSEGASAGAEGRSSQASGRQLVVVRIRQVPLQHHIPGPGDLREDTNCGRLLVRSLMRAQLGLSLMCLAVALAVTASFPVIAALVPEVSRMTVAGLPVTLIVLGFAFYPVLFAVGWFYNRQARQLEARFTELVEPESRPRDV
ncbi:MAG TPA: hypothetical protein VIY52_20650 [Streptosporangiaceae bacterium]